MKTYPPQEAIDLFRRRTSLHVQRVRDNIYLWQDKHTEFFEELSTRALDHDKSKFFEPELTPYIWLTWENHCLLNNIPLELDQEIKYSIAHAISHHVTKNRHHPEYHSNPDNMTKVDLVEMVCDWKAMNQEMGEKSPMDYANRVLGKKFHFSPEKCEEIKKIIIELDEMCEEEEKIKQRLKEITPSNKELLKMVEKQTYQATMNLSKDSYWHSVEFKKDGSMIEGSWYMSYIAPNSHIELDGNFNIAELDLIIKHMKKVIGVQQK